jgi:nucleoside-diphosphate-sugar epimerase
VSVVVTGSAGFLGRVLTRRLLDDGHRVVGIDRVPHRGPDGPDVITADLLAGDPRVEVALREAEAVFHLAGCSGVRDSAPDVEPRRERDNVLATAAVAALVPPHVPLLVTSSSSVYGGARFGRASRESDPLQPRGGYAASKVGTEQRCARRAEAGGHVLVVRPFTVVGEGQRPDMALSRWAAAATAGRPLRVFGSLERTRDFTCVREVARGLTALAESGATGVVNLGSGAPRTLREAVHALAAALDVDIDVEVEPAAHIEVEATWADTTRFESLTGFRPHTDLADVVRRFVAAAGPLASRPGAPLVGAG